MSTSMLCMQLRLTHARATDTATSRLTGRALCCAGAMPCPQALNVSNPAHTSSVRQHGYRAPAVLDRGGGVTQDMVLFNDTIYYNILYGRLNATPEDVFEAARKAAVHDQVRLRLYAPGHSVRESEREPDSEPLCIVSMTPSATTSCTGG